MTPGFTITNADREFLGNLAPPKPDENPSIHTIDSNLKMLIAGETTSQCKGDFTLAMRVYNKVAHQIVMSPIFGSLESMKIPIRQYSIIYKNKIYTDRLVNSPLYKQEKLNNNRGLQISRVTPQVSNKPWNFKTLMKTDRRLNDRGLVVIASENINRFLSPENTSTRIPALTQAMGLDANNPEQMLDPKLIELLGQDGWWQKVADNPDAAYRSIANTSTGLTLLAENILTSNSAQFSHFVNSRYSSASSHAIPLDHIDQILYEKYDDTVDIIDDTVQALVTTIANSTAKITDYNDVYEKLMNEAFAGGKALNALSRRNMHNITRYILSPLMARLNTDISDIDFIEGIDTEGNRISNVGFVVEFKGQNINQLISLIRTSIQDNIVNVGMVAPYDTNHILITLPFVHHGIDVHNLIVENGRFQ
jgi:hypothetical protein